MTTGLLTYFAGHNPAEAALAGISACTGAIALLNTLID
jgi:hypothetical protein